MRKWIQLLCVVVMVYCVFQIGSYFFDYQQVEQELEQVQQSELQTLQQQYTDVIGWLSLEDSRLDNPVLQTTNNDFYLTHNYQGEKSRGGSIYLDYRNKPMADRHTIFYGHVLRNETMFGGLSKFAEQSYAQQHPVFIYETANQTYALEVFAAYETTTDVYYLETEFTDETYAQFLTDIAARSQIDLAIDVTTTDKIVTLSTCTTSQDDRERFVVHAKVVKI